MWNIVSNTNDPVGGDHQCGNRLLYQIQTMLLVATVDVERGLLYRIQTMLLVVTVNVERGSLYQIKTIMVVKNIEEELDCCI